jgi:YesN/AraC family two-component response regulator
MIDSNELMNHPLINSIGHEIWTKYDNKRYDWECRKNEESICIFQYTIAGKGMLEINGKYVRQTPSSVFLIERPGNYHYWLPEDSEFWEFKFISLTISSLPFWNYITSRYDKTFKMLPDNPALQLWDEIYNMVEKSEIQSIFDNSLLAYKFLMTLHKYLKETGPITTQNEPIQLCLEFINREFGKPITLSDIAQSCQISPFYLNKCFREVVGETPIQYLTKVRIRHSTELLSQTSLSVDAIAKQCGFQNANYFAKVFKKATDLSPTEYKVNFAKSTVKKGPNTQLNPANSPRYIK